MATKFQNENYEVVIAVDIGLTGGIAFFDTVSRELLALYSMPVGETALKSGKVKKAINAERLKFILEIPKIHNDRAIVVMENIHAFRGQGLVSMSTLLEQKGLLRGLAIGLGYDVFSVEPKTWQKFFNMTPPKTLKGTTASQTKTLCRKWLKGKSLEIARNLYKDWAETKLAANNAHGLSDALLIGTWFLDYLNKDCL